MAIILNEKKNVLNVSWLENSRKNKLNVSWLKNPEKKMNCMFHGYDHQRKKCVGCFMATKTQKK